MQGPIGTVRSRARRRTALPLIGLFAALALPTAGNAAAGPPRVFCMLTFGTEIPTTYCDPNPNQFDPPIPDGKVYPSSKLYDMTYRAHTGSASKHYKGSLYVEGNATPGSSVRLTVTDGVRTIGPFFVDAAPAESPGGPRAGDFGMEIMVSGLGGHVATPDVDEDIVGDDELGPNLLTITATPIKNAITGPSMIAHATKHAASHGDLFKPSFSQTAYPPVDWERQCPIDTAIDLFFYFGGAAGIFSPADAQDTTNCAVWPIAGTISDDSTAAGTKISEISEVKIEITQGGVPFFQTRSSQHPEILTRYASNYGRYRVLVDANDFPVNRYSTVLISFNFAEPYVATVTVCDAWGNVDAPNATNCAIDSLGDIYVSQI